MNQYLKFGNGFPNWFYQHDDIQDIEKPFKTSNKLSGKESQTDIFRLLLPIIYLFDLKSKEFIWGNAILKSIPLLDATQWQNLQSFELSLTQERIRKLKQSGIQNPLNYVFSYKTVLKNNCGVSETFLHRTGLWGENPMCIRLSFGILFRKSFICTNEESGISLLKTSRIHQSCTYHKPCSFSARESEILLYMSEGFSSKQIAAILNLSEFTIINHRKNMLEKSGKPNAASLVSHAIREKII